VIKISATCKPCLTKTCPDARCIRVIQTERVLEVVREMLNHPHLGWGGEDRS